MDSKKRIEDKLLASVTEVILKIHPHKSENLKVTLESQLEGELGFDSLGKIELLSQIEQVFNVKLPDHILATADKTKDLLEAVLNANPVHKFAPILKAEIPDNSHKEISPPTQAETLNEVLDWFDYYHPDRPHITYYDEKDQKSVITYRDLKSNAEKLAAGLVKKGLKQGDSVAIMLPTGKEYFYSFFGILYSGGIPVPIYPPAKLSQIEDHLKRHAAILKNAGSPFLITVPEAQKFCYFLKAEVEELKTIVTFEELTEHQQEPTRSPARTDDTAFLQYTSGSTGNPKGVILSHRQLLANIRIMGKATRITSKDVFISWLPLYHDMGLIGAWLGSLYHACPLVILSPISFLLRPERWLKAIHQHRGSISAGPNFAYELCCQKIKDEDIEGIDLSSWRCAFNGAEQVSRETIDHFCERFKDYGFKSQSIMPVYGLAEASLGLTFPPHHSDVLIDEIDKEEFLNYGIAIKAAPDDPEKLSFVSCGRVLPGYEIRIIDKLGNELPDREQGQLQFQGPSITSGYYHNPEDTQRLFDGNWVNSGDLAYRVKGDYFITGRVKDVIIRAGRNIYPHQLEETVGDIEGIRKGCVAIFGSKSQRSQTEKIIILAETRLTDKHAKTKLREKIDRLAFDVLGVAPDDIVLSPPQTLLKTSSGKIRRSAMRELYEKRNLEKKGKSFIRQMVGLYIRGTRSKISSLVRFYFRLAYGIYAWILFLIFSLVIILGISILPGKFLSRAFFKLFSIIYLGLVLIKPRRKGYENLPEKESYIVACNHASYIDAFIVMAAMPKRILFVAKGELGGNFILRFIARKSGVRFVDRFDRVKGARDVKNLTEEVKKGASLLFFPEGTFIRKSGLLPFRMGAFKIASETGCPVVPASITGTRFILKDGDWMPRPGKITITIAPPIKPAGADFESLLQIRNQTRQIILDLCGEPDCG